MCSTRTSTHGRPTARSRKQAALLISPRESITGRSGRLPSRLGRVARSLARRGERESQSARRAQKPRVCRGGGTWEAAEGVGRAGGKGPPGPAQAYKQRIYALRAAADGAREGACRIWRALQSVLARA